VDAKGIEPWLRARWAEDDATAAAAQNAKAGMYSAARISILAPAEVARLDDGKTIEAEHQDSSLKG
jgi:hypothetical protein